MWGTLGTLFPEVNHVYEVDARPRFHLRRAAAQPAAQDRRYLDDSTDASSHVYSQWRPFIAPVLVNRRLTSPDNVQDVRHIELDIRAGGELLRFEPGDVCAIAPKNVPENIARFLALMNWEAMADDCFEAVPTDELDPLASGPWSRPQTLRSLLENHLDVFGIPRMYFFEVLSRFAMDPMQREKLLELSQSSGIEDYYNYCQRPRRTAFEVLQDFDSARTFSIDSLFDLFPLIRPRLFSIASSYRVHPHRLHLTVAVVLFRTIIKEPRRGICSQWLASLSPSSGVPIWIVRGSFSLPRAPALPMVFIGTGTGIAPLRAMLQERIHEQDTNQNLLIFGNRSRALDFLYSDEWKSYEDSGKLRMLTAFSRDQPHKIYVQDRLKSVGDTIWRWIHVGGVIFLCGYAAKYAVFPY